MRFQNVSSNRQLENAILCGTSPVHDDGSDKSMDDDEHHIDHKDHSASTVTVDNGHYIVAASGKFIKLSHLCKIIYIFNEKM